jgi:hypothetical protein
LAVREYELLYACASKHNPGFLRFEDGALIREMWKLGERVPRARTFIEAKRTDAAQRILTQSRVDWDTIWLVHHIDVVAGAEERTLTLYATYGQKTDFDGLTLDALFAMIEAYLVKEKRYQEVVEFYDRRPQYLSNKLMFAHMARDRAIDASLGRFRALAMTGNVERAVAAAKELVAFDPRMETLNKLIAIADASGMPQLSVQLKELGAVGLALSPEPSSPGLFPGK